MSKWYQAGRVFAVLLCCIFLAACSSKASKVDKPKKPKFEQQLKWETVWKANGGEGLGKIHLGLAPDFIQYKSDVWVASIDHMGKVTVLDAYTGKRIWRKRTKTEASSNIGQTADAIVFGTQNGEVIALAKEDGSELWRTQISTEVLAGPAGRDNTLAVLSIDSRLHGLDAATGKQRWIFDATAPALKLRGGANPLTYEDSVLVGFANGQLGMFDLNSGAVNWIQPVAVPRGRSEIERMVDINGRMGRRGDTAYVATYHGRLAAVDLAQQRFVWTRELSSYQGLAVTNAAVIVTDADSNVTAYDRYSGDTLWVQSELNRRYLTAPVVFGDYVVVADVYGYAFALSLQTGQLMGFHKVTASALRKAPLVDSEGVIIQTHAGRIFKIRPIAKG
jgi:outer membrane protein assembly factor BamB